MTSSVAADPCEGSTVDGALAMRRHPSSLALARAAEVTSSVAEVSSCTGSIQTPSSPSAHTLVPEPMTTMAETVRSSTVTPSVSGNSRVTLTFLTQGFLRTFC